MRALAIVCALAAVVLMVVAIAGMVTGRPGDRGGLFVRAAALILFGAAVALSVASH
jgi:hypothetical protein